LPKETAAFKQMIEAVKLLAGTKVAEAEEAYKLVAQTFPEKAWSFRLRELDGIFATLREYTKVPDSAPVEAGNLYLDAARRLTKYGIKI
jgi:hypothetical protein